MLCAEVPDFDKRVLAAADQVLAAKQKLHVGDVALVAVQLVQTRLAHHVPDWQRPNQQSE